MNKPFVNKQPNTRWFFIFCLMSVFIFISSSSSYAAVLTHGPVVGGVTGSQAKIFIRTNQGASVKIEYSPDPNFLNSITTGSFQTSSTTNFTTIISIQALSPQTTYYLNVYVDEVPQFFSSYPSFKTFPATTDPQSFKFVMLTDFKNPKNIPANPIFFNAIQEIPDFCFIGGDFDHTDPKTLSQKRQMFNRLYNPNSLVMVDFVDGILRRMPIIHQWDDHDAGGNNIDKTYPYWNRSYRVFREFVPTYELPSASFGIWQYFQYAHVDFFVLDERSQRDPDADPDDINKSMLDGNNLGSSGQLEWLKQGLLGSTARWKIIFTPVVTNPSAKINDSWGAFQTEWKDLRKFIQDNDISGIIFISGDLHIGGIDNGAASGFPEMVVPPVNLERCLSSNRLGRWSEGTYFSITGPCNGYGVVTVLMNPDRLLLEVKDENGNTRLSYTVY